MTNLSNIGSALGGFFGGNPGYTGGLGSDPGPAEGLGIMPTESLLAPPVDMSPPDIPAVTPPTMAIPTAEQVSAKEAASAETERQRKKRGYNQTIVNTGGAGGLGSSGMGLKQTLG